MTKDIYFFEVFKEEDKLLRKYLPEEISAEFSPDHIQDSKFNGPPAKFISIRTYSVIPESWLDNGKILGIISRTKGFDNLKKYCKKIPCGYLPDYCTRAVAEQAIMIYMSIAKKLKKQVEQFYSFDRDGLTGTEIKGKNMLIVGVGKIGHDIHKIAKSLEMKVYGVDIIKKHEDVDYIEKDKGIENADVIMCSMNLTKDNVNYFNYETLKKTKPGTIFINISRGEFSPSQDLLKLIEENHLGGLGLDVYNKERALVKSLRSNKIKDDEEIIASVKLASKDNVICTPHNAFNTKESIERKSYQTIKQLKHFLKEGEFIWKVPSD